MDPFTLALLGSSAASLGSSFLGSKAASKAAGEQSQAAMMSSLLQAQQADQARQDILRGQQQAASAITGAQAPTLESLRTSSQQAQDLMRGGTTAASAELQAARQAAIDPLLQAQQAQQRALMGGQRQGLGALGGAYGQQYGFQQPYLGTGGAAQNQLAALYGVGGDVNASGYGSFMQQPTLDQLQMDPGYAFRLSQGEQAMNAASGASGMRGSGAALKAATRYGQEAGSQEYANAYNRFMANRQAAAAGLQGLAGSGQGAANVMSQAAGNFGTGAASIYGNTAANLANIYGTTGQNVSNIQAATGQNLANLQAQQGTNLAANVLGTGQNIANVYSGTGTNLANVYTGTAPQLANISLGTGQALGTGLENAAQARASGYMGGATALSQALQQPAQNAMAYTMMNRYAPQSQAYSGFMGAPTYPA